MDLHNVMLPLQDSDSRWDIRIEGGEVVSMTPCDDSSIAQPPNLLLPALCHPHIHLDKPYLLTCNQSTENLPNYSDLVPRSGNFTEALDNTSKAKHRYNKDDLYLRGSQLLASCYTHGVASLRAFVELDHVTKLEPLRAAMQLKKDFHDFLDVQICAFAQDPIFSTGHGEENKSILLEALRDHGLSIDVIGTTPYVESDVQASRQNMQWAVQTALQFDKHLDFHIEFNLTGGDTMGSINYLLDTLVANCWPTKRGSRTVVLGHATRLTLASHSDIRALSERLKSTCLPLHFVGLPTSDLFMMGRPTSEDGSEQESPLNRVCGTLNVPKMIQEYGLDACLSVNNVGNAFTPYGDGDPLALASWGVGLFHAGRLDQARVLYEAVSSRAMEAITPSNGTWSENYTVRPSKRWYPMLLVRNQDKIEIVSSTGKILQVKGRPRLAIQDVVWDPPEIRLRSVIR